jgi:hypothetical protein
LIALGLAGGGAAFALASIPDGNGVIHGCVLLSDPPPGGQPLNGANLHITDSSSTSCGSSEQPISWNVTGPAGPAGPAGSAGPTGQTGPTGAVTVNLTSPPIKNSAKPVATLKLGTGHSAIGTSLLGLSLAKPTGKVKIHDLSFTQKVNKASAALFRASASGKHFTTAIIVVRKAGGGGASSGTPFLEIKLQDVVITSVQDAPSGGAGTQPQEHVTLNFQKIAF